jgi:PAS domain S-box-containing protein
MKEQFSVLIVEDDVNLAATLQDILHDAGYRTVAAHDGRTALALCSEEEFDLAILDLKLPDISGTKLAEDINKLLPETEYVINTGYASLDTAIEAVKHKKIISYETKPVDIDRFLFLARQVAQRRNAQAALKRSEKYFQALIENASDLIVILDADGKIRYESPSVERIIGYKPKERTGKSVFEFVHPEDMENATQSLSQLLRDASIAIRIETRIRHKDGSWRAFEVVSNNLLKNPVVGGIVLNIRDITERKRAEEALQQSERQYSALVQNLTDAVFLFQDGIITWCNDKVEEIYGYPKEELLGKHVSFFYPPEANSPEFIKTVFASLREKGGYRGMATFRKKDNSTAYLEYSLSLIPGEGPIEIIAVARDVSERKRVEDKLKESEARYRAFVETAGQAGEGRIMIQETLDGSAPIIFINDGFSNILGFSREETTSMSAWDLFSPDDLPAFREWHRKRLNNEDVSRYYDITGIHKSGGRIPLELSLGYLNYQGKKTTIIYFRDITERKQVEKERERLFAELAEKTRELEQIVYVTSHDLRSPLVNIQGFTRELDHAFKEVNKTLKGKNVSPQLRKKLRPIINEDIPYAIRYILTSSAKMDSLLSGLLRLSRLGRTSLNIKQLDMNELMADVVASFEFQIKESKATVVVDDLPPCYGDETQVNQVFSNLLDNALKFLKPKRKGHVRIWSKAENGGVVYCVEDNGIGIAEKDKQVIFEIFRRLDPEARSGEGLGLTIVRKILDKHGGKVWVESEPGKGSKFLVSLPAKMLQGDESPITFGEL